MSDSENPTALPARRGFFGRLAGMAAFGLASAQAAETKLPDWPGALKGRHKQLTDGFTVNSGFPLYFTLAFLNPNPPGSATAVVILRHEAMPMGLSHAMWEKYKIGAALNVTDPETHAIAVKNPFLTPKPGALLNDRAAVDQMLARGVVFGVCNQALRVLSKMLGAKIGVSPADAEKEWTENVIKGMSILPSGTWGVNRAQEAGCTYCSGG